MRSASGVLGSLQQLGMALGIAVLGTIPFGIVGADHAADAFVDAARTTDLVTIGMIGPAFAVGFFLPRKPRAQDGHAAAGAPEPAFA